MINTLPGFYARPRRRKSGKVVTYYFVRLPGAEREQPLGSDYERAVEKYRAMWAGTDPIAGTIEEALTAWERDVLPTKQGETRRGYEKNLKWLRPVFGRATWDAIRLADLGDYLAARKGKVQANREVSLLGTIWRWAQLRGYTDLPWPAAGLERSRWKNPEKPRTWVPDDAVWQAIYQRAEPMLRDCMDLAEATAMRLTDCRTVALPRGDVLRLEAHKTGKAADFDLSLSAVLPALIERRRALKAPHLMLLSMPDGTTVTPAKLRGAWDRAREAAASAAEQAEDNLLAADIRRTLLRDARKRAGRDLPLAERSQLLQHSSLAVTDRHYPGAPTRLKTTK